MRHRLAWVAAWATTAVAGCVSSFQDVAAVAKPHSKQFRHSVPPPALQPDTVVVQQLRIDRPDGDPALSDRLWRAADDHFLDAEQKAELARHGLRAAKLPEPTPAEFLALLDDRHPAGSSNQMLAGHPFRIELTGIVPEHTLFRCADGALRGETLRQVQGYLLATPMLAAGDRVKLAVEPRLELGEPRPQTAPGAGLQALEWQLEREAMEFPELRLTAELANGQCLLVGPLPEAANTLGGLLFRKRKENQTLSGVVVIRVLRPSADERFRAGLPDDSFGGSAARFRTPAAAAARSE